MSGTRAIDTLDEVYDAFKGVQKHKGLIRNLIQGINNANYEGSRDVNMLKTSLERILKLNDELLKITNMALDEITDLNTGYNELMTKMSDLHKNNEIINERVSKLVGVERDLSSVSLNFDDSMSVLNSVILLASRFSVRVGIILERFGLDDNLARKEFFDAYFKKTDVVNVDDLSTLDGGHKTAVEFMRFPVIYEKYSLVLTYGGGFNIKVDSIVTEMKSLDGKRSYLVNDILIENQLIVRANDDFMVREKAKPDVAYVLLRQDCVSASKDSALSLYAFNSLDILTIYNSMIPLDQLSSFKNFNLKNGFGNLYSCDIVGDMITPYHYLASVPLHDSIGMQSYIVFSSIASDYRDFLLRLKRSRMDMFEVEVESLVGNDQVVSWSTATLTLVSQMNKVLRDAVSVRRNSFKVLNKISLDMKETITSLYGNGGIIQSAVDLPVNLAGIKCYGFGRPMRPIQVSPHKVNLANAIAIRVNSGPYLTYVKSNVNTLTSMNVSTEVNTTSISLDNYDHLYNKVTGFNEMMFIKCARAVSFVPTNLSYGFKTPHLMWSIIKHLHVSSSTLMTVVTVKVPDSLPLTSQLQSQGNLIFKIVDQGGKEISTLSKPLSGKMVVKTDADGTTSLVVQNRLSLLSLFNKTEIGVPIDFEFGTSESVGNLEDVITYSRPFSYSNVADYDCSDRIHKSVGYAGNSARHDGTVKAKFVFPATYTYQGSRNIPSMHLDADLDLSKVSYKNPSFCMNATKTLKDYILMTSDGIFVNGGKLMMEFEPSELLFDVSYIGDPLHVGFINNESVQYDQIMAALLNLGQGLSAVADLVDNMENRLQRIESILSNSGSSLTSTVNLMSQIAMLFSPVVGAALVALSAVVQVAELAAAGVSVDGVVNTLTNVLQAVITIRFAFGMKKFSGSAREKLDQQASIVQNTQFQTQNPLKNIFTKRRSYNVTPEKQTVSVSEVYAYMDDFKGTKVGQYFQNIAAKMEVGRASLMEKSVFSVAKKFNVIPMHAYTRVDYTTTLEGKSYRGILITGIGDGNAATVPSNVIGRGSSAVSPREGVFMNSPGTLNVLMTPREESSGLMTWKIENFKKAGHTKEDIATAQGYSRENTAWKDWSDEVVQDNYEELIQGYVLESDRRGLLTEYLRKPRHVITRSNMNIMKGQVKAFMQVINSSKRNRNYNLIGENCQNYNSEARALLDFKKPSWVTNASFNEYLETIYGDM
uniref:Minor outer capsid protein n=1 Tax=Thrips tabaci associated reovirus 1 TaxID=2771483 RepID=A0A7H1D337_9REOV|nr:minor outer capsid protein [Thrips tabaci associated reovirus 1]